VRINVAVPEPHVSAPVLDAALEGVTRLNEDMIRAGAVPTFREALRAGVRWKPEPPGAEHFDHAGVVIGRRWGDCDDLAPYEAASLRVTGRDPGAVAVVKRSGPKRWHAVVRRSDGSIVDPSRAAGMGRPRGVVGATQPPMFQRASVGGAYVATPQLALRPVMYRGQPEAWQARTDLPWHWQPGKSPSDVAMVSLHRSPYSDQALVGACHGAIRLGECSGFAAEDHMDRIAAIRDACEGADWEELAHLYGEQHATAAEHVVGSLFGSIFKGVTSLAKTALPFVPGVGPIASAALEAATPLMKAAFRKKRGVPRPVRRAAAPLRRAARATRAVPGPGHRHQVFFTGPPIR